ncbi:hypothetical protein M409DRAFT_64062 [Zasmidium cellare ATCC 36951]|uniref:Uncharacterized protein n=1 Tax=Zasmidium cellare ATCC 36951 TaxID=1080233 RepID=A0A6A6D0D8_ZASCE|nr:uncharacterized protein M409DRAFT_64062 [Zasmidium cellare ATCC 36951]KAF2171106.1 hypothetical protein M409DRAFT_64062 [Zasmidium cellare ATCC 36951]
MADNNSNAALAWAWTIGWWICYPIGVVVWYLAVVVLFILNLLYRPVAFLLQPFVYLGRFILACLVFPFTLAARLETIYIYLGVAAIVGLLGGLFMRGIYNTVKSILHLDARPEPKLRSAKQYREEKRKQKMKVELPPLLSPGHLSPGPLSPGYLSLSDSARKGKQKGLLAQTIMEEEDSDF